MSLSVDRVKHMLDVAKKERQESWDDMDEVGRKFSDDCVTAFEELIAIKEEKPVAYIVDADNKFLSWDGPIEGGNFRTPLIRKPE